MADNIHKIRRVLPEEKDRFVSTILQCFVDDHFFRAMYPNIELYETEMAKFVEFDACYAIKRGTAWVLGEFAGACLWIEPNAEFDDEKFYDLIRNGCHSDYLPTAMKVFDALEQFIPGEPHWYLSFMGIVPAMRDRGLGSKFLNHTLEFIDTGSQTAYLETFDERNVPFYQRLGFKPTAKRVIDDNMTIFIMKRPARQR